MGQAEHITSNFLKTVFRKFYLVRSWIPWPIYSEVDSEARKTSKLSDKIVNPFSANPTKWSSILKQFVSCCSCSFGTSSRNCLTRLILDTLINSECHYMKTVRFWSFSGLYWFQMRENTDQQNSKYKHFSHIVYFAPLTDFNQILY